MLNGASFPEGLDMLMHLAEGQDLGSGVVHECLVREMDWEQNVPVILFWKQDDVQGVVDRTEYLVIDYFTTPGQQIPELARFIARIRDRHYQIGGVGFFDDVAVEKAPRGIPYQNPLVGQAQATVRVTARPVI